MAFCSSAQFYGIFVPTEQGWKFVHKTLRDYLGARFWVEANQFSARQVTEWTAMAAYAACLTPDATDAVIAVLQSKNLAIFAEMVQNDAPFNDDVVAKYLINYYKTEKVKFFYEYQKGESKISAHLHQGDVVRLGANKFLVAMVRIGVSDTTSASGALMASAIVELANRDAHLPGDVYSSALKRFGSDSFVFNVNQSNAWIPVRLRQVSPEEN